MTSSPFQRDRLTWLLYLLLGFYAFMQAALGPIVPFLRAELNLSYTVTGFHVSAFALGMLAAGVTADVAARRFGRKRVFFAGGSGMALGALLIVVGRHPAVTVAGAGLMGFVGSFLLIMIQATIADHHGAQRSIGFTESNIAASLLAIFPALLIRLGTETPVGWRLALWGGVVLWILLAVGLARIPIPASRPRKRKNDGSDTPLPTVFWGFIAVIFLVTSVEWSVVFWGADFLENRYAFTKASAALAMGAFFGAALVGRILGSILVKQIASRHLLIGALLVVWVGFPIFWLGTTSTVGIIGLLITGVGIANLFPLTLAAAANAAPDHADTASARVSIAVGAAIFMMPQLLAALADISEIMIAFGVIPIMLALATGSALLTNRLMAQTGKSN
jgi:fucose permease